MHIINRLERKIGWIAIPGIVRVIMCFQVLVFVLVILQVAGTDDGYPALIELLYLDFGRVLRGEVWRLVTFIFLPPTFDQPLFMLITVIFTVFLGELLESLWGSFRTTLYILGSMAGAVAGAALLWWARGVAIPLVIPGYGYTFSASLLFAVAVYHPHLEIRLFFIIPVKMMWLAIFGGATYLLNVLRFFGVDPVVSAALVLAISNFLVVFVPGFRRALKMRGEVAVRRRRFEAAKASAKMAMHECSACGKTENDDADLVFRVAADGEEYCSDCRAKRGAGSA